MPRNSIHPLNQGPIVFRSLSPAKPTVVYDTYWRFAAERQEIFFRRLKGNLPPWTNDPILQTYKFTNAYRASDRVSQYLIQNVIYSGDQSVEEIFFRTILFKLFNRIETWELIQSKIGEISYRGFHLRDYEQTLDKAMNSGKKLYSAAYIMPSGGRHFMSARKHGSHLRLLEQMMSDRLPDKIANSRSMKNAFELLRSYPSIGDFLAYQYVTDINYSEITNFSEMDFVIPGPGAKNGIRKCFSDFGGLYEADLIRAVSDRQPMEFERLGLEFKSLWQRPLQLIDCQNLFCEVDKYARVAHPEAKGLTERTRIKQKYRTFKDPIRYWYPPKWGINSHIPNEISY
jgi:hypothetical protein